MPNIPSKRCGTPYQLGSCEPENATHTWPEKLFPIGLLLTIPHRVHATKTADESRHNQELSCSRHRFRSISTLVRFIAFQIRGQAIFRRQLLTGPEVATGEPQTSTWRKPRSYDNFGFTPSLKRAKTGKEIALTSIGSKLKSSDSATLPSYSATPDALELEAIGLRCWTSCCLHMRR